MSYVPDGLNLATADFKRSIRTSQTVYTAWRLYAYGSILFAFYFVFFFALYKSGIWLVDAKGAPIYTDFTNMWVTGAQALHGGAASVYDPAEHVKAQQAFVGTSSYVFPNWPYPPTYLLLLAPLALMSYFFAFLTWNFLTLLGTIGAVHFIVRRPRAIAAVLLLASPFAAWNLSAGQTGLLTAALFGGSLLLLERRPALAGLLIGLLSYKPHLAILFPVALAASSQWRALTSAAITATAMAGASVLVFGTAPWVALPQQLFSHADAYLFADLSRAPIPSMGLQTIYGLVRALHGSLIVASLTQRLTALAAVVIVWLVWRSATTYSLKAATLSAAALVATPYAYAYDMAAMVIPLAFLASTQIRKGLSRGEQAIIIGLPVSGLMILVTFGAAPLAPAAIIAVLGAILHQVRRGRIEFAEPSMDLEQPRTSSAYCGSEHIT